MQTKKGGRPVLVPSRYQGFRFSRPSSRRTITNIFRLAVVAVIGFLLYRTRVPPSRATLLRRAARASFDNRPVAVYDKNKFHDEVHGAVIWTLRQFDNVEIYFYRQEWRWGFADCVKSFWTDTPRDPKTFIKDMREAQPPIRHVIFTTCDWDYGYVRDELQVVWEERPENEKFDVICLRHWTSDGPTADQAFFAQRNSTSLVGLGDHVGVALSRSARDAAKYWPDEIYRIESLRRMAVRTFVPMFPPDMPDEVVVEASEQRPTINSALIQSTFWDEKHRAMNATWETLFKSLREDPFIWGYSPPTEDDPHYRPLPQGPGVPVPFELQFMGAGKPQVPAELQYMTRYLGNSDYPVYYRNLNMADIILPAFGTEGYEKDRASSTIGVAATARAPILVSNEIAHAYGYFCDDIIAIRPDGMQEIEFIKAVRAGEIPWRRRDEIQKALINCQDTWTAENMMLFAELFVPRYIPGGRIDNKMP